MDRVAPGIYLPLGNIEASVKELERAAKMGLRPALMPDMIVERSAGWLAFGIQLWDHYWTDNRWAKRILARGPGPESVKIEAPPSHYLKRQAHATFMWDPVAIRQRDITGLDCLLWGNDYPHDEGSFPDSQQWIEKQFAGVPEHEIDQVVGGNAARIFGLNV